MNSIRVLLSIAANLDWPLNQFDVKMYFFLETKRINIHGNSP
jgi:hypothetical protein